MDLFSHGVPDSETKSQKETRIRNYSNSPNNNLSQSNSQTSNSNNNGIHPSSPLKNSGIVDLHDELFPFSSSVMSAAAPVDQNDPSAQAPITFSSKPLSPPSSKSQWLVEFDTKEKTSSFFSNYITYYFTLSHGIKEYRIGYRFSELYEFHCKLTSEEKKEMPDFPEKVLFGSDNEETINARSLKLEKYLGFVFGHPQLREKLLQIKKPEKLRKTSEDVLRSKENENKRRLKEITATDLDADLIPHINTSLDPSVRQYYEENKAHTPLGFEIPEYTHIPAVIMSPSREDIFLEPILQNVWSSLKFMENAKETLARKASIEDKLRFVETHQTQMQNEARILTHEASTIRNLIDKNQLIDYPFVVDYMKMVLIQITKATVWENEYAINLLSQLSKQETTSPKSSDREPVGVQSPQSPTVTNSNQIPKKRIALDFSKLAPNPQKRADQYRELAEFLLIADEYDEKRREKLKMELAQKMKQDYSTLERANSGEYAQVLQQFEEIGNFLAVQIKTLLNISDQIKECEVRLFHLLDFFNKLDADNASQVKQLRESLSGLKKDVASLKTQTKHSTDDNQEQLHNRIEDLQEHISELEHNIEKTLMKDTSELQVNHKIQQQHARAELDLFEL